MSFCIIVPYRDRAEHLSQFKSHYAKLLPDVPIYVIEQEPGKAFNRAKLLNIGYLEFGKNYDYSIYHDVDMLAHTADAYDIFPLMPMHLASACSQFDYKLPYPEYFGGVTSISTRDMAHVNGFGNEFWGWGCEDDDMYRECLGVFGGIHRYANNTYKSLSHERPIINELYHHNLHKLKQGRKPSDGLSSCTYDVIERHNNHIIVSI